MINTLGQNYNSQANNQSWYVPSHDKLKVNVDSSVGVKFSSLSIDMLLRDQTGTFLRRKTMQFKDKV